MRNRLAACPPGSACLAFICSDLIPDRIREYSVYGQDVNVCEDFRRLEERKWELLEEKNEE